MVGLQMQRAPACGVVKPTVLLAPSSFRSRCCGLVSKARHALAPRRQGRADRATARASPETQVASVDAIKAPAEAPQPWDWQQSDDALVAYGALAAVLAAGYLPFLHSNQLADLPYFVGLALCTIYIGAHRALTTRSRQQITIKEGILAPVFASVSLFGFYLILKYFPDLRIQDILNAYFFMLGTFALCGATGPLGRRLLGPLGKPTLSVTLPEGALVDEAGKPMDKIEFAPSDVIALVLSLAISTEYLINGKTDFTTNNLIACLVATDILQLIGLRSFRTAGLLLTGLLLYDVFWVFGSPTVVGDNVMLAVATSDAITGPTRLLFPRVSGSMGEGSSFPFSLLGLGDVAIPGLLACLALRYDVSRSVDMKGRAAAASDAINAAIAQLQPGATGNQIADATAFAAETAFDEFADREQKQRDDSLDGTNERKGGLGSGSEEGGDGVSAAMAAVPVSDAVLEQRTYFIPVMVAYAIGLLIAFAANSITNLGQPALLYLCPWTLGAVAWTAAQRGELMRIWKFTDVPTFGVDPKKEKKH